MIPTSRPKYAPMAIDGTKIPAGTLAPYEMMTSKVRMRVARNSEFTIVHWAEVLTQKEKLSPTSGMGEANNLLTEVVVIPALVTLPEQYRHAFRHIDPQKSVEVSNHACENGKGYSLGQSMVREMPTAECGNLQVELYDDSSVQTLRWSFGRRYDD